MKKCPICGNEYEHENVCPICGIPLIDTETNSAVASEPEKKKRFSTKKKKEEPAVEEPVIEEPIIPNPAEEYAIVEEPAIEEEPVVKEPEEKSSVKKDSVREAQEEDIYGLGVKPASTGGSSSGSSSSGGRSSGDNVSHDGKVTISFKPAYVVAVVVILLLIVAAVFIVRGMKAKKEAEQMYQYEQDVPAEEPETTEEEIDLSLVDVNAVNVNHWEYTGKIDYMVSPAVVRLDPPLNFYAYTTDNKKALLEDVSEVCIDSSSSIDMRDFDGKMTTVTGSLTIDNDRILMSVTDAWTDEVEEDDTAIHEYNVVISDVSWSQAKEACESAGGYLARINSVEEYNYITNMLTSRGYTKQHFYLGGRRDASGSDYYWVNQNNEFIGDALNRSESWSNGYWYINEPSFVDTGSDANGNIQENVMNLFYVNGTWYLNDSSDNLAANYPSLLSGKVGYIIEFE